MPKKKPDTEIQQSISDLRNEISKLKRKSLLPQIITWIIALIAIGATISTNLNRIGIAKKSGKFKTSKIEVGIGPYRLSQEKPNNLLLTCEYEQGENIMYNLPISIINNGDKNFENVNYSIGYPNKGKQLALDNAIAFQVNKPEGQYVKREFYRLDNFDNVSYKLEKIQPGTGYVINDIISYQSSESFLNDGDFMGYKCKIHVFGDNETPVEYELTLWMMHVDNFSKTVNHPNLKKILFSSKSNTITGQLISKNQNIIINDSISINLKLVNQENLKQINYFLE
jgi:hypothetical protein